MRRRSAGRGRRRRRRCRRGWRWCASISPSSFSCECKALDVDMAALDPGLAQVAADGLGHRGRGAQVDLALVEIRHELAQVPRGEEVATLAEVVAHDEVEGGAPVGAERL